MNIPQVIRIIGKDYAVQYEDRLNTGTNMAHGHIDFEKALIRLNPSSQEAQGQRQTLLHEIIHGICDAFDFDLDEGPVDKLATGLFAVIQDNPALFAPEEESSCDAQEKQPGDAG